MGCVLSSNQFDTIESPKLINSNDLTLEFLIILKEHDFEKKNCCSLLKEIKKATTKLPGIVHICSYKNVTNYKIKGLMLPYMLYMKLPKEDIYVSSDAWESEYFNSQTLELLKIFTILGASDIKFKTSRDHNDGNITGIHTNANLNSINIPLKMGAEIEHYDDNDDSNAFDGQIKIKKPNVEKYENLNDMIEKNNLHYVKNNYEWQSLISYKLKNDTVTKLKYNTTFYKGFKCGTKITADLEAIGISVCLFDTGSKFVKTTFEVHFYDEFSRDDKSGDSSSGGSLSIHI